MTINFIVIYLCHSRKEERYQLLRRYPVVVRR